MAERAAVRTAGAADAVGMVALSAAKRRAYARVHPLFWAPADGADERQRQWFLLLMASGEAIALVVDGSAGLEGFLIARPTPVAPVYDPGGGTWTVDDFCVATEGLWELVGAALVEEVRRRVHAYGANQLVVVCGSHDGPKREVLRHLGLAPASEWWVGNA